MDNPEEIYYNSLEEQYVNECAKFNVGDVVYFEHKVNDKTVMVVGIVLDRGAKTFVRCGLEKETRFTAIVYDIITPNERCESISECKICSASEFIFKEYLKCNEK